MEKKWSKGYQCVTAKKKGMSTVELGNEVSVQQKKAWFFKSSVRDEREWNR